MKYKEFSEIEKNILVNCLINNQSEQFEMMITLIEERIKMLVPNMIQQYLIQNPQKIEIDTNQAEKELSNLFKNIKF